MSNKVYYKIFKKYTYLINIRNIFIYVIKILKMINLQK